MLKNFYLNFYNFFFNYGTPNNLTNSWNFGILAFAFLMIQLITGLFLSMYYIATDATAFVSVETIMRDINMGWQLRYFHANGASFFFFFVYLHFFRNLYYFSFIKPRLIVWNTGVILLLLMIVAAFTGYVLPWGQMSFWAATVITNLFSAVPIFGKLVVVWLWGSFSVATQTLTRFFTFHFVLPFVIAACVFLHFFFLHKTGSSNSLKITKQVDKIPFHPYYTVKDFFVVIYVIIIFFVFVFYSPNYLSHSDNYIPADPLSTPAHIVPEWYFSVFYAMLRSVPSKLGGIIVLLASIIILFVFPFFVKNFFKHTLFLNEKFNNLNVKKFDFVLIAKKIFSIRDTISFFIFIFIFISLSYIGMKPIESPYLEFGRILTAAYFFFFFLIIQFFFFKNFILYFKSLRLYDNIFYFIFTKKFKEVLYFYINYFFRFLLIILYKVLEKNEQYDVSSQKNLMKLKTKFFEKNTFFFKFIFYFIFLNYFINEVRKLFIEWTVSNLSILVGLENVLCSGHEEWNGTHWSEWDV